MLYLTQFVYVKDGKERTFEAFEDIAIPLIPKYRGALLLRIRPNAESIISAGIEVPYEIHIVRFENEDDFQRYSEDEERKRVLHLKNASVRSAILVKGTAA
jgi:antibiotic biosynthesis monooxygenase (ABM) superfamily enzyme